MPSIQRDLDRSTATGQWLLTARALQGACAALLVPASLALVDVTFTRPTERARALGEHEPFAGRRIDPARDPYLEPPAHPPNAAALQRSASTRLSRHGSAKGPARGSTGGS